MTIAETETETGRPVEANSTEAKAPVRAALGTALLVLAAGAGILFANPIATGAILGIVGLLYIFRATVFSWQGAAVGLAAVVCLVPARRYTLPVSLPFAADPYRIYVLALLAVIVVALLVDPRFTWRRLELAAPVGVFLASQLLSIGVNVPGLVGDRLAPNSVQSLVSLLIICAIFVVTRQLLQSRAMVKILASAMVLFGTVVGVLAVIEKVTRVNLFLTVFSVLPLHRLSEEESVFVKAGTARAFGSAQHPIALAVFLCMLLPLAVYLARHADRPRSLAARELFWLGCAMLMTLGVLAAVSRTAFVSLAVMLVVTILLRVTLLPRIVVYGVLATGAALLVSARNIVAMVSELTDPQALIASQMTSPGWTGSGRLSDLGPSLQLAAGSPFFGGGLGSRVTIGPSANALILDDQYLTTLLESGAIGVLAVLIMLGVPFAAMARLSRRLDIDPERRDLALAVAVAIIGYAVSLAFFDGFSFIQTLLTFLILLALGSWALAGDDEAIPRRRERADLLQEVEA